MSLQTYQLHSDLILEFAFSLLFNFRGYNKQYSKQCINFVAVFWELKYQFWSEAP